LDGDLYTASGGLVVELGPTLDIVKPIG